ncbi:hypothetical protein L6164_026625 [Bauhinia variegata]|uniref:Uncharacterized protein n=1 Tax=Bauhinia variegata TaxID=167791 RepID=A0ACB9LQP7_BAUVA|nr:hypothetical protein L6164_026625 [Bauhinia variegata]
MAVLQKLFMSVMVLLCMYFVVVDGAIATATYYNPPYTHKKSGVMIAAASKELWNNRAVCGKRYRVKCLGATNRRAPYPCKPKNEIEITIVDLCPGCKGLSIDLSREAFGVIAALSAGRIDIQLLPL